MLRKFEYNKKVAVVLASCILIPSIIIFCVFFRAQIAKIYSGVEAESQRIINAVENDASEFSVAISQKARFIMFYSELNNVLMSTEKAPITPEQMQKNTAINNVIDALFSENNIIEMSVYTTNRNAHIGIVKYIDDESEFNNLSEDGIGEWRIEEPESGEILSFYKKYRLSSDNFNVIKISVPFKSLLNSFSELEYANSYIKLSSDTMDELVFTYNSGRYNECELPDKGFYKTSGTIEPFGLDAEIYVDTSAIHHETIALVSYCIVGFILLIVLIFAVSNLISKRLLKEIMDIVEGITTNNADFIERTTYGSKEIEIIKNYLVELRSKLKAETDERLKFELEILSERISPHFLYNNLSAIKYNCQNATAKKAIDRLVKYYRNVFQKGGRVTTVPAEIENGVEYLNLLKFSYEKDFEIDIEIDEECVYRKIPANILQPVLENAFIHGINNNRDNREGYILISAKADGEDVVVNIADNGGKFNEERFRQRMQDETKNHALKTIIKRMKLYYNDDRYTVTISGNTNETIVSFRFGKEV